MGMFKDRVLMFLEGTNLGMREIREELRRIREENELQTLMLRRIADNQTSSNKKPNKPQEATPAPKTITWQEAARVLAGAAKGHCKTCELQKVCAGNFRRCAEDWEVPADE